MTVDTTSGRTGLTPRRRELIEAALHVVADEGLRGLTHRAVDRRAELPEGSCSAYFRTRRALQTALTEYVVGTLAADVSGARRGAERLLGRQRPRGRADDRALRPLARRARAAAGEAGAVAGGPS